MQERCSASTKRAKDKGDEGGSEPKGGGGASGTYLPRQGYFWRLNKISADTKETYEGMSHGREDKS